MFQLQVTGNTSDSDRIRLLHINPVLLDRPRHILRRHLPLRRQRSNRGMRDVEAINLEMPPQIGTRIRSAEAVGAEDGVAHRHIRADLFGVGADVVGGDDGGALLAFEQLGDVALARGLGFGVHAVEAFGVDAVARELNCNDGSSSLLERGEPLAVDGLNQFPLRCGLVRFLLQRLLLHALRRCLLQSGKARQ